jgi:hypothetical protein
MQIHRIKKMPVYSEYWNSCELNELNICFLEDYQIEEAWYWYGCGEYEGSGKLLMRIGDKYDIHDMNHCSCYGPTANITFTPHTLTDLKALCSNELMREVGVLFDAAESALNNKR